MKTFKISNKPKTQSFNPEKIKSIKEFGSSSDNKVNGKLLKSLPIDQIMAKPQVRTVMENIEELAESMKVEQLLPITVCRTEDDRYTILQGERRWLAAKMAGLENIDAIIVDAPKTETDRILSQLTENIQRDNMKLGDLISSIKSLVEMGSTQSDIAKRLGKDRTYISRIAALSGSHPLVEELIKGSYIQDPQTAQIANLICEKSHDPEKALESLRDENGCISRPAAQRLLDSLENNVKKIKVAPKVKAFEDRLKKREIPKGFKKLSSSTPVGIEVAFDSEDGTIREGFLLPRLQSNKPDKVCILCKTDHKILTINSDKVRLLSLTELH